MKEENNHREEKVDREDEDLNNPHRRELGFSEIYRKRYEEKIRKSREEERLKSLRGRKIEKPEINIDKPTIKKKKPVDEQKVLEEVESKLEEGWEYLAEPKHIRVLKIIAILIPLIILGYLFYANFLVSQDFNYVYDIGSIEDAKTPYLSPVARVSEIENGSGDMTDNSSGDYGSENYRNIIANLVYFNINIPRNSEEISIQTRFKDNFPNNSVMSLGAQDRAEWHYLYKPAFYSSLSNLGSLYQLGNVYLLNEELNLGSVEEIMNTSGIVIASDLDLKPQPNKIEGWEGETVIDTTLRGGHVFYIYISGNLSLDVKKQDLNWYNNSDELNISLYDLDENLIVSASIPDDGITDVKSKQKATIQSGSLEAGDLSEGVYKIVFTDFDGLIREIKINTKKIITPSVFLADSSVYLLEDKKSKVYTKVIKNSELKFLTYHSAGIQNITYNKIFNLYQEDAPLYLNLTPGEYSFEIPKNDLILSYPGYFSFSKDGYFEPFKQRVIKPEYSLEWLKNNADYFVSDYQNPMEDDEWLISETEFNIEKDNLFVNNNQLSMVFNVPHVSQEANQNYTIPIDWIKVKVHKPGLFEKWGEQ